MSVFTPLERPELEAFLAPYELGRLRDFQGIAAGSENSNFFVSLERGEYVLTLIERGPSGDLPFFIDLLDVLHGAGLPVPYALRTTTGEALRSLAGKPALLQPRLAGKHVHAANPHHCQEVGALLARIHLATRAQPLQRKSDRGLDWMLAEGPSLALQLPDDQLPLLRDALAEIHTLKQRLLALPQANLHADLFRDNVLFAGDAVAGVIDFYFACTDALLYDVAIAVNDWCVSAEGTLDVPRTRAFLDAYAAVRPYTPAEHGAWPMMLRAGALRFWVSRLYDFHLPRAGELTHAKDPGHFRRILELRIRDRLQLPELKS